VRCEYESGPPEGDVRGKIGRGGGDVELREDKGEVRSTGGVDKVAEEREGERGNWKNRKK